jgi:uncharacterized integral membrane protein
MGEARQYQPLTRWDRLTVVFYRAGIVISALILCLGALMPYLGVEFGVFFNFLLPAMYAAVALSVFFIHLYVRSYKRSLIRLYALSLAALAALYFLGQGNPAAIVERHSSAILLLLPLSGCLGFVAAKEAFCFRLIEGYVFALTMPLFILLLSTGLLGPELTDYGVTLMTVVFVFFTARKVFTPLHLDIGDKSAYV